MGISFHASDSPSQGELIDAQSLVAYIENNEGEGELYVREFSSRQIKYATQIDGDLAGSIMGMKVLFDTNTGKVCLKSITPTPGVQESFSEENFNYITQPVRDAITLHARIFLLEQLDGLNDPDISKLIRKNHFDLNKSQHKCTVHLSMAEVEKTFFQILTEIKRAWSSLLHLFKPGQRSFNQKVIYDSLNEHGIENITCKTNANEIMADIRAKYNQPNLPSESNIFTP